MLNLTLETERLYLTSTSKKGIEYLIEKEKSKYPIWFGDEEINKYNSHGLFPQTEKELNNFFDRCENDKSLLSFLIIEKESKTHIGMCSLQRIDFINRSAEFAIIIGEKNKWGFGYGTEAIKKLIDHAFLKLGLNRIWSGTSVLNIGMIKSFEKLGMQKEGIYKQGQFLNGKFEDIVCYSILREEYDGRIQV
jgi:[ribosomal protein S5]-alanine N-acetyltransferase